MKTHEFVVNQTVRKFEIVYGGMKWQTTANGGTLVTEQEMNDALPGRFYDFVLQSAHSELGVTSGSLLVFPAGEEINQFAVIYKTNTRQIWLRGGVPGAFDEFTQLSGGGGGGSESDPIFTTWLQETPPVLVSENKITTTETTAVTVGGLAAGTNLVNKNPIEVLDLILYPELFQVASGIIAPSFSFLLSISGLQEVESQINISKTKSFTQGAVTPQYQTATPYRSGNFIDFTDTNPAGYAEGQPYTVVEGVQNWTCKANYLEGPVIKGSKGTAAVIAGVTNPLPAGSTAIITRSIIGVYPVYATTANIWLLTKQALLSHGADIAVSMVAESAGKQTIRIPQVWGTIDTLQQYNTLSGTWDNIALSTFTKTATAVNVNGIMVDYWEYAHNGATIGARQLKFKI